MDKKCKSKWEINKLKGKIIITCNASLLFVLFSVAAFLPSFLNLNSILQTRKYRARRPDQADKSGGFFRRQILRRLIIPRTIIRRPTFQRPNNCFVGRTTTSATDYLFRTTIPPADRLPDYGPDPPWYWIFPESSLKICTMKIVKIEKKLHFPW